MAEARRRQRRARRVERHGVLSQHRLVSKARRACNARRAFCFLFVGNLRRGWAVLRGLFKTRGLTGLGEVSSIHFRSDPPLNLASIAMTKRDLVVRIAYETGLIQEQVFQVF